jgi:hypothetical protein
MNLKCFGVLLALPFFVCVLSGTALAETRTFPFTDFTEVSVGGGMHLEVTQSPSYSIQVTADSDDMEHLKVDKKGDMLSFSMQRESGWWHHRGRISVSISMPLLSRLELSGGAEGQITMDTSGRSFYADMSGGSSLEGNLKCGDADFGLSGGAEVRVTGTGNNLKLDGSGGSEFHLRDFAVTNVNSDLSGGSEATVNMDGVLRASQSGGSEITYYGKATVEESDSSGGSKIRKGN